MSFMQENFTPNLIFQKIYELKRDEFALIDGLETLREQLSIGESDFLQVCSKFLSTSKGQLLQDIFVLYVLDFKKKGTFVEFGAVDGIYLSNTLLLEREYSWSGLLSEPAVKFQKSLLENRNCHIELKCIWKESGTFLEFADTEIIGLSTIAEFQDSDSHKEARKQAEFYQVPTITLNDALNNIGWNGDFDYLSIDTEGSEIEILNNHDFTMHSPLIITCEHNFMEDKKLEIYDLLTAKGYVRVFDKFSLFESWFVRSDLFEKTKSKF